MKKLIIIQKSKYKTKNIASAGENLQALLNEKEGYDMKRKIAFVLIICLFMGIGISTGELNASAGGKWMSDATGWWYSYADGNYALGWTEIDNSWYYFCGNGYMDYSEYRDGCWLNTDGSWNTVYSGGHWASDSSGWWYTDSSGWYPVSTWLWIDGGCYFFKSDGYMAANEWIDGVYVDSSGLISSDPSHTHNWVWVVDKAAYDEDIYEDRPVYEDRETEGHYEATLYGQPTSYHDSVSYANAVVGPMTNDNMDAWNDAADYFEQGFVEHWVPGKTEKVQVGTEKVQTGTKHHDEVGHYECSCGATRY